MIIRMCKPLIMVCLALAAATLGSVQAVAEIVEMDAGHISNYSQYTGDKSFAGEMVGFGGATQPEAMEWLKQQGFSTVINLRLSAEDGAQIEASERAATEAGLKYINLPFNPKDPAQDIEERFLAAAGDSYNQPVYIHCGSATRASIMWMMGRALQDGVDPAAVTSEGARIAGKPEEAIEYFSGQMANKRDR